MTKTTYWVVREIASKAICGPAGVSSAPHLYLTKGKAEARRKTRWQPARYEVVAVELEVPA